MHCKISFEEPNKKLVLKRLIALAICVFFIAGSLLSAAFIFSQIDHEHDHNGPDGDCVTCSNLMSAEQLLKSLSAALAGAALTIGCISTIRSILESAVSRAGFFTLVAQKVRLNN